MRRSTRIASPLSDVIVGGNVPIRALAPDGVRTCVEDPLAWAHFCIEAEVYAAENHGHAFGEDLVMDIQRPTRYHLPLKPQQIPDNGLVERIHRTFLPLLANPKRDYGWEDYVPAFAGILVDPVGSSAQRFHSGFDRHAVWNVVLPITLPDGGGQVAESIRKLPSHREPALQTPSDILVWDSSWPHRETGNQTQEARLQLHIVFVPRWMLGGGGWDQDDVAQAHKALVQEYNGGFPMATSKTPMHAWWLQRNAKISS